MKKFTYWISSSKNISFDYTETFDLDDLGLTEEEWQEMSQEEKQEALDNYAREITFNDYVEYGASEDTN